LIAVDGQRPDYLLDIGCATIGSEESIEALLDRFAPVRYLGFDPNCQRAEEQRGATLVSIFPWAAWSYDGRVGFQFTATSAHVDPSLSAPGYEQVQCFDLARYVAALAQQQPRLVLKLDCEGAEYTLLPALHERGLDAVCSLLLVEWHGAPLALPWRCVVEEW
jgi:FkbM family methyltransferase